jgi:hypothetical protein
MSVPMMVRRTPAFTAAFKIDVMGGNHEHHRGKKQQQMT